MSAYTLDHIIDECLAEKAKQLMAPECKRDMYIESWTALNNWIETRFFKRKVIKLIFLQEMIDHKPIIRTHARDRELKCPC
jgi:hypothetical protein